MTVSFLNPGVFWALPLIALPLLLHRFFRRRRQMVLFSDLRFVQRALEKVHRRFRVRHILLLVTRTLIVLFVILFFSRPVLRFGASPDASSREDQPAVVLLIDVSYSMGYQDDGKTRLEHSKGTARKILSLLPPSSRVGVVAYSDRIEAATPAMSGDRNYLSDVIDTITISCRPTNTAFALAAAEQFLSQVPGSNRSVIILSDLAKHGFKQRPEKINERTGVIVFAPEPAANRWISSASAEYDESNKGWYIDTTLRSLNNKNSGWPIDYYADGRKIGSDSIAAGTKGHATHRYMLGRGETRFNGYAELAADGLNADDRFYLAAARPAPYKMWIIDGDPKSGGVTAESFYLRTAFPQAEVIPEREADRIPFSKPGVVVLANVRNDHPAIERFIDSGGGAMVFPGDHYSGQPGAAYLPAEIGSLFEDKESVRWIEENNPLQPAFPAADFDWEKITVNKGFILRVREAATVLAGLSSGLPFIVQGRYGDGEVVLFSSSADREWNSMPARPLYAPLMRALARFAVREDQRRGSMSLRVGDVFRIAAFPDPQIAMPSGKRVRPVPDGNELLFSDTEAPGIYRLYSGDEEAASFAVNLDVRSGESDLTVMRTGELKGYFSDRALTILSIDSWEKQLPAVLSGKDMTRINLLLVFVLLMAEIALANPLFKRSASFTENRA